MLCTVSCVQYHAPSGSPLNYVKILYCMLVSHTNMYSVETYNLLLCMYHLRVGLLEGEAQEKSRIGFLGLQENVELHVKTEQSKQQVVHIVYVIPLDSFPGCPTLYASSHVCFSWVATSNTGIHVHIAIIYKKCTWLP